MKKRNVYKDTECPPNLMASRTHPDPAVRVSGALCEAIQRNFQWVVEAALREITIEECQALIDHRKAQLEKEQAS